jgi:tetratricopeptide (TPR) repeat protein
VTGGRIAPPPAAPAAGRQQAPAFAAPGDWNACTILDTRHNLQACRGLADPARRGSAGRSAAHFLDGLRLAWDGDLDGALESFDRSIALAPDLSVAYLNRGLAYRQKGNADRALADFGRAIASDPDAAPAYYHRSQLLRAQGKTARAEADLERAIRLAAQ